MAAPVALSKDDSVKEADRRINDLLARYDYFAAKFPTVKFTSKKDIMDSVDLFKRSENNQWNMFITNMFRNVSSEDN